jgi:hypothetical protein
MYIGGGDEIIFVVQIIPEIQPSRRFQSKYIPSGMGWICSSAAWVLVVALLDYLCHGGLVQTHCLSFPLANSSRVFFIENPKDRFGETDMKTGDKFCIGAAPMKGVEDSRIKTLGRWERVVCLEYVCRLPIDKLTGFISVLAAPAGLPFGVFLSRLVPVCSVLGLAFSLLGQ